MTRKLLFVTLSLVAACVAIAGTMGASRLLANENAISSVANVINYQGYLTDDQGAPYDGSADVRFTLYDTAEGGASLWTETHIGVPVTNGYFNVLMGSQDPLLPSHFSGDTRYLQLGVDTSQSGVFTELPRQRMAAVPYALQAGSAPWSGLTDVPLGFADGVDDAGANYAGIVVVAKSGGHYSSIMNAMNAITPTDESRYLIYVAPGTYQEQVTIKEYVHLKGAGVHLTRIEGSYTGDLHDAESAVVTMGANAQLSHLSVVNNGTVDNSVGIRISSGNDQTTLDHVRAEVTQTGGDRHVGVYTSSGQSNMSHVDAIARGANNPGAGGGFNWGAMNNAHDATLDNVTFYGDGSNGGSASGLRLSGGNLEIAHSTLRATNAAQSTGLDLSGAGSDDIRVNSSTVWGDNLAVSQTSGNYTTYIGASLVSGGGVATAGTLKCAQSYDENYNDVAANCN